MFNTLEVESIYQQLKPFIKKVIHSLNDLDFQAPKEEIQHLQSALTEAKKECWSGKDQVLNDFFLFDRYVDLLSSYVNLWEKIAKKEFASSWDSLQDTLDLLRILKKFLSSNSHREMAFFEDQLQGLEKLFPYNIFVSIGALVEWFECSICGEDVNSLDCPHIGGELYRGQMARRIARNLTELDHISLVKYPADKRCVVKYENDGEQFSWVRFLSELVVSGRLRISDFGELKFGKRKIKNPEFKKIGRNDFCYCRSGKKFKKCCISKEYTESNHMDIVVTPRDMNEIIL